MFGFGTARCRQVLVSNLVAMQTKQTRLEGASPRPSVEVALRLGVAAPEASLRARCCCGARAADLAGWGRAHARAEESRSGWASPRPRQVFVWGFAVVRARQSASPLAAGNRNRPDTAAALHNLYTLGARAVPGLLP